MTTTPKENPHTIVDMPDGRALRIQNLPGGRARVFRKKSDQSLWVEAWPDTTVDRQIRQGTHGDVIPLELAALAAGRDAWMRKIDAACKCCGTRYVIGETEVVGYCPECADESGEENARLDGATA